MRRTYHSHLGARRASNPADRRVVEHGRAVPELAVHYAFMRDAEGEERLTIARIEDRDSKIVFSGSVETKGQGVSGTIQRSVDNITRIGFNRR